MATLNTFDEVNAELAATASYDVDYDISLAKRRVVALRRKLDFAQQSAQSGSMVAFQMQTIENQLNQVLAWVRANDTPSDAQRLKNPQVTHADFSTFRGGGGGAPYPEGCY
jgi:hypothetical protein